MGSIASRGSACCFEGLLGRFATLTDPGRDVVVIVGPSGVGKSTLIKRLMEEYAGRFGFSVSHTTRQPRAGEQDGVHYNFTEVPKMQAAIDKREFIEYANVHGNLYGTSFLAVQKVVGSGRICLLDIDVQGAESLKKSSLNANSAYIFIAPPSVEVLEERLRGRGTETEEKIQLRLKNARKELAFAKENPDFFGEVLVNSDLEQTYDKFRNFMRQYCGRHLNDSPDGDMSPGFNLRSRLTPRPPTLWMTPNNK